MDIQETDRTLSMVLSAFQLIADVNPDLIEETGRNLVHKAKDVQHQMGIMYSKLEAEVRTQQARDLFMCIIGRLCRECFDYQLCRPCIQWCALLEKHVF